MTQTIMAREIASIPEVVARMLGDHFGTYAEVGQRLAVKSPAAVLTCARGSSDHAALYFKYLTEMTLGVPVCSMGPSMASIYDAPLAVDQTPVISISQSGGSKDICALTERVQRLNGLAIALCNTAGSPLSQVAGYTVPMGAGPEKAVAATKTYVCSLIALAAIVAHWSEDQALMDGLLALPDCLARATQTDWSPALEHYSAPGSLFVTSRGPTLAIAQEAALKFKETCELHAEAYSAAEVLHGPVALAGSNFSAISFATRDAGAESVKGSLDYMKNAGAAVHGTVFGPAKSAFDLPVVAAPHVMLDPISQVTSFYSFVEKLSVLKGLNPDAPELLKKVTVTE